MRRVVRPFSRRDVPAFFIADEESDRGIASAELMETRM